MGRTDQPHCPTGRLQVRQQPVRLHWELLMVLVMVLDAALGGRFLPFSAALVRSIGGGMGTISCLDRCSSSNHFHYQTGEDPANNKGGSTTRALASAFAWWCICWRVIMPHTNTNPEKIYHTHFKYKRVVVSEPMKRRTATIHSMQSQIFPSLATRTLHTL